MRFWLAAALIWTAGASAACGPDNAMPGSLTVGEGPIDRAWYGDPTDIYRHGILGDAIEAARLFVSGPISADQPCGSVAIAAGRDHVFEDVAPRLTDLTGDGVAEVIAVRTHLDLGAQLAVYGLTPDGLVLLDATPYIGQSNRWLSPIGAADLDGDGLIEIAYIDRPHLAKTLRVWRWDGGLTQIAAASGLTNHRIGERDIGGGLRDCVQGPEMIVASGDWTRVLAVRLVQGTLQATDLGPYGGRESFASALACR